ncbi:laccase domain protein [Agaricicola taiwanensis]|uniref:Purine nucleoside phosphorylase n=1 Tax=Agaricicola taiwanensis TaxID=591372 RepID=A0A8J2YH31_9RHOB|nr:peptidoglycan editing factor PgeF [Agaricicola taiwanensis]GGE40114.1 laccase domain protein [Agaricicola taiwanensis]
MTLSPLTSNALTLPGIRHAFFTREGGISQGIYASLNGGIGSDDAADAVAENRRRMAAHLGVPSTAFLSVYQVHSADALIVEAPFDGERPRADALVTKTPGLALAVSMADCGPVLFADPKARVVAAAHSGWKGAVGGILEATLQRMEELGASRTDIIAVLGPCIRQPSYEVGAEFAGRFAADDQLFFIPSDKPEHFLFDLSGYILSRLKAAGLRRIEDLALDTYADEQRFFSYRRTTHRGEPDYGRLMAGIVLHE